MEPQPFAGDQPVHRFAGNELHGYEVGDSEIGEPGLADVVDSDDVRMIERGGGLGFLDETALALGIAHPDGGQKFESDEAVETCIAGFPHHAHSARAEL